MKPNTLYQRRRRARLYEAGLTSQGLVRTHHRNMPRVWKGKPNRTKKTKIEMAWEAARTDMKISAR